MPRISTLDLMRKNYNVSIEATKLKDLFFESKMFQESSGFSFTNSYTYAEIFDGLLLRRWKFRQTYINCKDILIHNKLDIDFSKKYSSEELVNFIEIMNNLLYFKPDFEKLKRERNIYLIYDRYTLMIEVLNSLIEHLGLVERKSHEGWYVLVPKNETLDKAIEGFKPVVQWEIISYLKIKSSDLEEKRKHLAYLATELYIEKDENEKGYKPFETIINECTLILNNLHIRHNNETGKWENTVVKSINKKGALEYCEILYNKMLLVVLMRKDLKNQNKIEELSKNLKKKV